MLVGLLILLVVGFGSVVASLWRLERAFRAEVDAPRLHRYPLPIKAYCGHEAQEIVLYPGGVPFCRACHETHDQGEGR